jgi:hypothetical protein
MSLFMFLPPNDLYEFGKSAVSRLRRPPARGFRVAKAHDMKTAADFLMRDIQRGQPTVAGWKAYPGCSIVLAVSN